MNINQTNRATTCLAYLKSLANNIGLVVGNDYNILAHNYDKIKDYRGSVMEAFLTGSITDEICSKKEGTDVQNIIYPFGFNLSQKKAVENALSSKLSIIEGPPGTGKTQTILNIIANLVCQGKTVAVVSGNNSAIANIEEKLKKYDIDFICAMLGSRENVRRFLEKDKFLPDMHNWRYARSVFMEKKAELKEEIAKLNAKLDLQNQVAVWEVEKETLRVEEAHFLDYYNQYYSKQNIYIKPLMPSDKYMKVWAWCEEQLEDYHPNFFKRFYYRFKYGINDSQFYGQPKDVKIATVQKYYYNARLNELGMNIEAAKKNLESFSLEKRLQRYTANSMDVFKSILAELYDKFSSSSKIDFYKPSFLKRYPVVLSTAYSLINSVPRNNHYDYVIMDEASQVDIVTGALAMASANHAVIVGDLKQLPNVVSDDVSKKTDRIFNEYDLSESYRYSRNSFLAAISKLFPNQPHVLLREHYRCNPKIIEFCNQKFYNGELIILSKPKQDILNPIVVYETNEGCHAHNRVNRRQIDMIAHQIIPEQKIDVYKDSVGIVTPYRNQTNELQKVFAGSNIQADTVDKFQGRERDVIIISTVDDEIGKFADDPNRLNVAISRAVNQLIVISGHNSEKGNTNLADLIKYIHYNNMEIKSSNINSVFDYLNDRYAEFRNNLLKKNNCPIASPAEGLIALALNDILQMEEFRHLKYVMHVPLIRIIKGTSLLTEEEARYAQRSWTHVDFLIYDKFSKEPQLVIEVDGITYHQEGSLQDERDQKKNTIFSKYGLSLLRLRTDGSMEKQRIIDALRELNAK